MAPIWPLNRANTEQWGFNKHWRSSHYHTGDIYQDNLQESRRKQWETDSNEDGPYLKYVKTISPEWPQLRSLADFMEVGTDPMRWRNFFGNDKENAYTYPDDVKARKDKQLLRVGRTRVRELQYLDGKVNCIGSYETSEALSHALDNLEAQKKEGEPTGAPVELRLFVVEDLSRDVIEKLGHCFDIDPEFFRVHIFDYAWFNIRDPFWNPPSLHMDILRKDWFQIRFCRARYFSSRPEFSKGQEAANEFNVGRKLYEDENKSFWDRDVPRKSRKLKRTSRSDHGFTALFNVNASREKETDPESPPTESNGVPSRNNNQESEAESDKAKEETIDGKVGLMRTNATFWKKRWRKDCDVGVLLLDPTIKKGFPLWRGYRNWGPAPSAQSTEADLNSYVESSRVPSLTRSEIDPPLEKSFFEDFLFWAEKTQLFSSHPQTAQSDIQYTPVLALLHLVCTEWLTLSQYIKTRLSQVDWEITHPKEFLTQAKIDSILKKLHPWRRWVPLYREMLSDTMSRISQWERSPVPRTSNASPLDSYKIEFDLVLQQMEEYEKRIDRLTTVVTSTISIVDSRRAERLTRLATVFVPLSLVATLFSMSGNIKQIGATFGYWAATSFGLLVMLWLWTYWNQFNRLITGLGD
ncbi:Fc.00g026760.m01.CDS01 [Cosmosporella sp. VM-42]